MRAMILTAVALALGACAANEPPPIVGRRSKGHTVEQMDADRAACRNQARAITGVSGFPYWNNYTDCMLSKGYEIDVGQGR